MLPMVRSTGFSRCVNAANPSLTRSGWDSDRLANLRKTLMREPLLRPLAGLQDAPTPDHP